MSNFQVNNNTATSNIPYEATSAYGAAKVDTSLDSYQRRNAGVSVPSELSENNYRGLLSAEASYAMAAFNLKNSSAVRSYNFVAKQSGYGNVNMTHRHDLDYSYTN